jgi:hypothetical protein
MFLEETGFGAAGFQITVEMKPKFRALNRSQVRSEISALICGHLRPINQNHDREAGVSSLSGWMPGGLCREGRERGLEFDSLRKGSVGWGVWFEFAGFNGCVDVPL